MKDGFSAQRRDVALSIGVETRTRTSSQADEKRPRTCEARVAFHPLAMRAQIRSDA
jgi:hypothetical protein